MSPYPQENDHCLFKGIINAVFISKIREYYVFIAFEGYVWLDHVNEEAYAIRYNYD